MPNTQTLSLICLVCAFALVAMISLHASEPHGNSYKACSDKGSIAETVNCDQAKPIG